MTTLTLPSPGKINRFFHILGQRPDGYHQIETAFQFTQWGDTLSFTPLNTPIIQLESHITLSPEDNLITHAARQLQSTLPSPQGVHITLDKQLPMGGGMGGGSSNAATTLLALNHLWSLHQSLDELNTIAQPLGADIPVFLYGQSCFATGIGQNLHPTTFNEPYYLLLLPETHCCTSALFQHPDLPRATPPIPLETLGGAETKNDFEPLVRRLHPEIDKIMNKLGSFTSAKLTGSGATVYGTFDTSEEASRIALQMSRCCQTVITRGCNESPTHTALRQIEAEQRAG